MIEVVVFAGLSCYGLHTVLDNLLFTFKGHNLDSLWFKWNEPKWAKPLMFCPVCMASVWGSIFYFIWGHIILIDPFTHLAGWLPSLFAIAGINYVISRI